MRKKQLPRFVIIVVIIIIIVIAIIIYILLVLWFFFFAFIKVLQNSAILCNVIRYGKKNST